MTGIEKVVIGIWLGIVVFVAWVWIKVGYK